VLFFRNAGRAGPWTLPSAQAKLFLVTQFLSIPLFLAFLFSGISAVASDSACQQGFGALEARAEKTDIAKPVPAKSIADQLREAETVGSLRLRRATVNNEQHLDLFFPKVRQGGVWLGLGGDGNLSLAAKAHSTKVVVYDFDPEVSAFWRLIDAGAQSAGSPEGFVAFFERLESGKLQPEEAAMLQKVVGTGNEGLYAEFAKNSELASYFRSFLKNTKTDNYLSNAADYQHIRKLFQDGKVIYLQGSHFDPGLYSRIAGAVSPQDGGIRNLYFSNALQLRWLIRSNPDSGLMGFVLTSSGDLVEKLDGSRALSDMEAAVAQLEGMMKDGKLEEVRRILADSGGKDPLLKPLQAISPLQMLASTLQMSSQGWNTFFQGLQSLPVSSDAGVFLTNEMPFQLVQAKSAEYEVLARTHEIFTEMKQEEAVDWDYTAGSYASFQGAKGAFGPLVDGWQTRLAAVQDRLKKIMDQAPP
jgi:hypothetical protein